VAPPHPFSIPSHEGFRHGVSSTLIPSHKATSVTLACRQCRRGLGSSAVPFLGIAPWLIAVVRCFAFCPECAIGKNDESVPGSDCPLISSAIIYTVFCALDNRVAYGNDMPTLTVSHEPRWS